MTKLSAVLLILAFPVLVAADINRLSLHPDLERPDALFWSVRRPEPGLTTIAPVLPTWEGACTPSATGSGQSRAACPAVAPQHVTRCLPQPDCRNDGNAPTLWPYAPRTDEQKTAAEEPRLKQAQVLDDQQTK